MFVTMDISVNTQPLDQIKTDALVVIVAEGAEGTTGVPGERAAAADSATGGWIEELLNRGEFSGRALELAILPRPAGLRARRLVVIGAGNAAKFTPAEMRKISGCALRALKCKKC